MALLLAHLYIIHIKYKLHNNVDAYSDTKS